MRDDSKSIIRTAHLLADAARDIALAYFRNSDLVAENKLADGFDPVTEADRSCERAMREILARERPDDAILGEEFPPKEGTSGLTWVLDPIDGTRAFIAGAPTWGVLIAIRDSVQVLYGIVDQPFTGERFEGGLGLACHRHGSTLTPLGVRATTGLSSSILCSTFPEVGTDDERARFEAVARTTRLTRYGLDCYAYALLALGQIDLVIEAGLNSYDIMAPIAVIEAAGGLVTNWQGASVLEGGQVLAAATPEIHQQALELLNA